MSNKEEIIGKIIAETPPVMAFSLREIAAKYQEQTGDPIHPQVVKNILAKMGIVSKTGQHRAWVRRHNAGSEE